MRKMLIEIVFHAKEILSEGWDKAKRPLIIMGLIILAILWEFIIFMGSLAIGFVIGGWFWIVGVIALVGGLILAIASCNSLYDFIDEKLDEDLPPRNRNLFNVYTPPDRN